MKEFGNLILCLGWTVKLKSLDDICKSVSSDNKLFFGNFSSFADVRARKGLTRIDSFVEEIFGNFKAICSPILWGEIIGVERELVLWVFSNKISCKSTIITPSTG